MDVLTDVAFGAPFGYLERDEDVHYYIKIIRAFMPVLKLQTNHPTINYLMGSRLVQAIAALTAKDRTGIGCYWVVEMKPPYEQNAYLLPTLLPKKLSPNTLKRKKLNDTTCTGHLYATS
jgi:hypothetical protein